jgi:alpha-1,3-glucan synthase
MFRIGQSSNPIVFPNSKNTTGVLQKNTTTGDLYVDLRAPGADKFRYSLNWGSSYSSWYLYNSSNFTLKPQTW